MPARHFARSSVLIVACALVLYWVMAVSVSPRMGVTGDEVVHITGGYSYWTLNDYRLHPENGNLPQRLAALPLLAADLRFPSLESPWWRNSKVNLLGEQFFFGEGNHVDRMLLLSRMMVALSGAFVVWLTWRWARGLFGISAGWTALVLAVFCPAMLAHGGLATSDMTMTACVLGALTAYWQLLHRVTWPRLLLATVACGFAFLSKMSGVIIIPVIAVMLLVRCLRGTPLVLALGRERWIRCRAFRCVTMLVLTFTVAAGSLIVLWGGFGFRYSGFNKNLPSASGYYFSWDVVLGKEYLPRPKESSLDALLPQRSTPSPSTLDQVIEWTRDHRFLPEAYLWGFAQTSQFARYRPAYLMGELRTQGWVEFFPLAFLLKTSSPALLLGLAGTTILVLSLGRRHSAASFRRTTKPWPYKMTPLLVFFAVYWVLALSMNLNIGHRHILPTYPVFYILASASVLWLGLRAGRMIAFGIIAALTIHTGESLLSRPFYLSYFQSLAGGPDRGYRYLVDSSFDWGQGLPDLKDWLERKRLRGDPSPVFLSYFGADSPRARNLDVIRFGDEVYDSGPRNYPARLQGGWHVVSATNFVQAYTSTRGPWTQQKEQLYRETLSRLQAYASTPQSADAFQKQFLMDCMDFERLQAARLFVYLKDRRPVEIIGGSLLVFRLTSEEINAALYHPLLGP